MGFNKIVLIVLTLFLLLFSVSAVSAADLIVNDNTTHKNITDWMNNDTTVKGNKLVFNVSSYELNDTIKVTKQVDIVSNKNTKINFYESKDMFYISTSGITFSGLTLNHHGQGKWDSYSATIFANSSSNTINFNKMVFNLNNNYQAGILIKNWQGTISNSIFNGKDDFIIAIASNNFKGNIYDNSIKVSGYSNFGVFISKWTGSIYDSTLSSSDDVSALISVDNWIGSIYRSSLSMKGEDNMGIYAFKWKGNVRNTKISASDTRSTGILSYEWIGGLYNSNIVVSGVKSTGLFVNGIWNGKISKSKIYTNAKGSFGVYIFSPKSKGTISKSTVSAKKGRAISVPKSIKIKNTKVFAKNKAFKILILGPKLVVGRVQYSFANILLDYMGREGSRYYIIEIYNLGEYSSKTSSLVITASGYKKVINVKSIKSGNSREITVALPKRLSNSKYKKYAKIIYYDGNNKKITSKSLKFK